MQMKTTEITVLGIDLDDQSLHVGAAPGTVGLTWPPTVTYRGALYVYKCNEVNNSRHLGGHARYLPSDADSVRPAAADSTTYTISGGETFKGTMSEFNETFSKTLVRKATDVDHIIDFCLIMAGDLSWTIPEQELINHHTRSPRDPYVRNATLICCGVLEGNRIYNGTVVYDIAAGLNVEVVNSMQAVALNPNGTIGYISWRHNGCWTLSPAPTPFPSADISKRKKSISPTIKSTRLFDAATVTREQLIDIVSKFHRGDTGSCNIIVGMVEQIAELRGFTPLTLTDVEPNKTHAWTVIAHDTKEEVWANAPYADGTTDLIDYMSVHGKNKYVALHWIGVRPLSIDVLKKVKQIGARSLRQS